MEFFTVSDIFSICYFLFWNILYLRYQLFSSMSGFNDLNNFKMKKFSLSLSLSLSLALYELK